MDAVPDFEDLLERHGVRYLVVTTPDVTGSRDHEAEFRVRGNDEWTVVVPVDSRGRR